MALINTNCIISTKMYYFAYLLVYFLNMNGLLNIMDKK